MIRAVKIERCLLKDIRDRCHACNPSTGMQRQKTHSSRPGWTEQRDALPYPER